MVKGVKGLIMNKEMKVEFCNNIEELVDLTLSKDEYLIKVKYAPINPADFYTLTGNYRIKMIPNSMTGLEGCGEIVEVGPEGDKTVIGKICNFTFSDFRYGSYSTFTKVSKNNTVIIPNADESFHKRNSFIANPLTALGLLNFLEKQGGKAFVNTGASSSVGKQILQWSKGKFSSINLVRNDKHKETLTKLGATVVINTTSKTYKDELKKSIKELKPTMAFDAVAGSTTGDVFNLLPDNSELCVYGTLSLERCQNISPAELIFKKKSIYGFHLREFTGIGSISNFSEQLIEFYKEYDNYPEGYDTLSIKDYGKAMAMYMKKKRPILLSFD